MKDLIELQNKLIELTDRCKELSDGHCKSSEPTISIGLDNDGHWFAEIYSYLMNFEDGGRHHYFFADTYKELISKLWISIRKEEDELKVEECK